MFFILALAAMAFMFFSKATLAGELYYQKEEDGIPQNLWGLNFLPVIR